MRLLASLVGVMVSTNHLTQSKPAAGRTRLSHAKFWARLSARFRQRFVINGMVGSYPRDDDSGTEILGFFAF